MYLSESRGSFRVFGGCEHKRSIVAYAQEGSEITRVARHERLNLEHRKFVVGQVLGVKPREIRLSFRRKFERNEMGTHDD